MAQTFPQPLIDLYNEYIHGGMSRRDFVDRIKIYAVGGLTTAAILEGLMPNYALGEVVPKNDSRLKTEYITVPSPQGNEKIKGYFVRPASAAANAKLPGILVVHENRGLNPHIEDIARRMGIANFMAFAPDGLTSVGGYPGDDDAGGRLFGQVDRNKMTEDFVAAAYWLKNRADCTGKIGVTGFCYGGGIANTLAVRMGADLAAAAPFYGQMPTNAADIARIKAAILVHHGATDARLAGAYPAYDTALKTASVTHEGYIYEGAGHGFNNDATPQRYNEAASKLAMERTIAWFNKYVRG
ncbi:MAG TPA: dienelactone hydrolase family protein [Terriglobia bacterium]|nr:dienelactone hydrolase family protein [Terriglobia bacterium]